jgi:hypothetical protein
MGLFFQILGVIFLLMIVFMVVAVLTIRSKIRGFAKTLEGLSGSMTVTPAHIHLTPVGTASWDNEDAVKRLIEPLAGLGFERVGAFQVDEVGGLQLEAWVLPARSVSAVVYDHPKAGLWLDLFTHFEDGTRFTCANTSRGEGVDHAPGHDSRRYAGLGTKELFERFMAERPDRPAKPVSLETFVETFERVYAEEMAWRNSRGGPTEQEIRNVAALSGQGYDDEVIEATHALTRQNALEQLDEEIRQRFLAQTNISAAEWERVRERVVVIHDQMDQTAFDCAISQWLDESDLPTPDETDGRALRAIFAEFNEKLPVDRRLTKLGNVSEPVEADVYAAPE